MARSTLAAQRAIFSRHATTFSPRDVFESLQQEDQTSSRSFTAVVDEAGRGLLPLLQDLRRYVRDVPLLEKPRVDLGVLTAAKRLSLRCWTAVLPWEVSYGLSNAPQDVLSSAGSVTGLSSGMLFLDRDGGSNPDRCGFWSGAITTPIDVAFCHMPSKGVADAHLLALAKAAGLSVTEAQSLPFVAGAVGNVEPLDPQPAKGDATTEGRHLTAQSVRGNVTAVLETAPGVLDSGIRDAVLAPSPEMAVEISEKVSLLNAFVVPMEASVRELASAIYKRGRLSGSSMAPADVELVSLAMELGLHSRQLSSEAVGYGLSRDVARKLDASVASEDDALQQRQGQLLSDAALERVRRVIADRSVIVPEELRVVWSRRT